MERFFRFVVFRHVHPFRPAVYFYTAVSRRSRSVMWPSIILVSSAAIGRKPPLMAEVGQSIFHERIIGIVRFMEAKGLRAAAGLRVWHGNCSAISTRIPL